MVKVLNEIPYSTKFMIGSMTNRSKIEESLLFSGVDQLDIILDIDLMLKEAKLTQKQAQVVDLYFFKQYTQEEISKMLGISQQAVLDHIKKVKQKMKKVLKGWEIKDAEKFNNR